MGKPLATNKRQLGELFSCVRCLSNEASPSRRCLFVCCGFLFCSLSLSLSLSISVCHSFSAYTQVHVCTCLSLNATTSLTLLCIGSLLGCLTDRFSFMNGSGMMPSFRRASTLVRTPTVPAVALAAVLTVTVHTVAFLARSHICSNQQTREQNGKGPCIPDILGWKGFGLPNDHDRIGSAGCLPHQSHQLIIFGPDDPRP